MRYRVFAIGCFLSLCIGGIVGASLSPLPAQETPVRTTGQGSATSSMLDRTITLHLRQVSLQDALAILATRAGLQLAYSVKQVPVHQLVSIDAESITVRNALTLLLQGTGVIASLASGGRLLLEPAAAPEVPASDVSLRTLQGTATISGVIRDSATGAAIPQVIVRIEGTGMEVKSGSDGAYRITGVAAGEYRVSARRVGYSPRTRTIVLTDNQSSTLMFLLNPPATKLDEIVTTAVGEQRRYQVGNVISTINVDSIAPTAPVTSVTDLLTGRAPGVDILETGGLTGSGEAIRIRGLSSLLLQSDPIVIVDGMRENNAPGMSYSNIMGPVPSPSRINDIDFTQIETIDVLKGPAATTEYGTDAANGVIVITTKHGQAGRPQWHVSAEQDGNAIPTNFPEYYRSWGHTIDGTDVSLVGYQYCTIVALYGGQYTQYGYDGSSNGSCVVDSITHYDPLNHAATTIFGNGTTGKYDLSLNGGVDAVRYYVAGNLSNAMGIARLPDVFEAQATALGFPHSALQPNGEAQRSMRANTAIRLGSTADLAITAAYLSTYQNTPAASAYYTGGLLTGPEYYAGANPDSANNYGYGGSGFIGSSDNSSSPLYTLGFQNTQQTNRLTSGMTANWHPALWLVLHGTVGLDHGSQQTQSVQLPQSYTYIGQTAQGRYGQMQATTDVYSTDLRATATASLTRLVSSVTSLGLQIADSRINGLSADALDLTAADIGLNGATNPDVQETDSRSATMGGYLEEQLRLADRLFLTGALRLDAGSGFGHSYSISRYPKLSLSWLALNNGPVTVRLRGALGSAGIQPYNGAAAQQFYTTTAWLEGQSTSILQLSGIGNPDLQPERSTEYEGGVDIGLWQNRASIELTGYSKTTHNDIVSQSLGFDLNYASLLENLGEVRNIGFETTITGTLMQARSFVWTATLNGSINQNKLVSVAPGYTAQAVGYTTQEQVPGYPLYGLWGNAVMYSDVNHDGIIEYNEASLSDTAVYQGPGEATRTGSLSTQVGLWHGTLALGAVWDYAGGYRVFNQNAYNSDGGGNNSAVVNLPGQAFWLQARAISLNSNSYAEDGTYVRFRELSVTYTVLSHWARAMHLQTISLTGAVRNLALWTRFTGMDPEVSDAPEPYVGQVLQTATGFAPNNDVRNSGPGAIPLTRTWFVRLNLGL